jgi:DNA-binding transcriptional LysR family regulator
MPSRTTPTAAKPAKRDVLRVAFVRGVTPTKWARIWAERRPDLPLELVRTDDADQVVVVHNGLAAMAFVRMPVEREGLNLIPLYSEVPVVVVPKDHAIAAVDEVTLAEIESEQQHEVTENIEGTLELVAAGVGVVVVPQSIARLHARRDLVHRPVTDAEPTQIALAWPREADDGDKDISDFIGVVRGRTARSSRSAQQVAADRKASEKAKKPAAKKSGVKPKKVLSLEEKKQVAQKKLAQRKKLVRKATNQRRQAS